MDGLGIVTARFKPPSFFMPSKVTITNKSLTIALCLQVSEFWLLRGKEVTCRVQYDGYPLLFDPAASFLPHSANIFTDQSPRDSSIYRVTFCERFEMPRAARINFELSGSLFLNPLCRPREVLYTDKSRAKKTSNQQPQSINQTAANSSIYVAQQNHGNPRITNPQDLHPPP